LLSSAPGSNESDAAKIPQRLIRQLFELDAGFVEALWGLDQPPGTPGTATRGLLPIQQELPAQALATLSRLEPTIRSNLNPAKACNMVPGQDPPKRLSARTLWLPLGLGAYLLQWGLHFQHTGVT
jgi:hypothetical protein